MVPRSPLRVFGRCCCTLGWKDESEPGMGEVLQDPGLAGSEWGDGSRRSSQSILAVTALEDEGFSPRSSVEYL